MNLSQKPKFKCNYLALAFAIPLVGMLFVMLVVRSRISAHVNEAIPPKREFKAKEVPITKVEYDY